MDELRKTKEEKVKGKVIISVRRLDENGEEISNKVYEDPTVIMMIMEPEQPSDRHVAVNGIIQGRGQELSQMANELTSEFEKKGLLRDRNPLADLFAGIFGGSGPDHEEGEHEHKCSDCSINDTCDLDPAVEFRAKNDQQLN